MPDGAGGRASLSTIREAIKKVQAQVRSYERGECDENARAAAIKFLDGLDSTVEAFCLRLTDGNEVLDPCPRRRG